MSTFRDRVLAGLPQGALDEPSRVTEATAPVLPEPEAIEWDLEFPWEERRAVMNELRAQFLYDRLHLSPEEAATMADEGRVPEPKRWSRDVESQVEGMACAWCHRPVQRGGWDLFSVSGLPMFGCSGARVVTCAPVGIGPAARAGMA